MPCHKPDCIICRSPADLSNALLLAKLEEIKTECVKALAETVETLTVSARRVGELEEAMGAAVTVLRQAGHTMSADALERILRSSH